jgi:hypothetical protein
MTIRIKLAIAAAIMSFNLSYAQDTVKINTAELTDASYRQKTGNSRDMLTDLFRLALSDLNTANGEINFTSTLYAMKLKKNEQLAIDKNYIKQTFNRNFQVSLGLRSDEKPFNFTQGTFGLAYALINNRDKSIADLSSTNDYDTKIADIIADADFAYLKAENNRDRKIATVGSVQKMLQGNSGEMLATYTSLDPLYKKLLDSVVNARFFGKETITSLIQKRRQEYLDKTELNNRRALMTLDGKCAYDIQKGKAALGQFNLRYLKGLGKNPRTKPLELEIKLGLILEQDTTKKTGDIDRAKFSSTLGLNGVLLENGDNESIIELKLFASYDNTLQRVYINEKQDIFAANATFRIKVSGNIWIPITMKYDLTNANFMGFLNVVWNLEKGDKKTN